VIFAPTSLRSGAFSRRTMARKKKAIPKLTPEELARRAETTRMLEERIAYHKAKAREEERAEPQQRG
jgi:hypothetical protein